MTVLTSTSPLDKAPTTSPAADVESIVKALETDGAVRMPKLVSDDVLREMQHEFAARLQNMRWNNCDGYERGERMRLTIQDVLTLSQGFVDLALHPLVKRVLNQYLGPTCTLSEAKGWRSLPTNRDFHGWHGDSWYDQTRVTDRIPREVKLAFYLTDVKSGAFQYIQGTHGKQAPYHLKRADVEKLPLERMVEFLGPAGTAVLFDTSGIHRQGVPILEPREAIFLNYHDPTIPLQQEDVEYYRYHPLLLNAAFLGSLSAEDTRILGFGEKSHYQPGFSRRGAHPGFQKCMTALFGAKMAVEDWTGRVFGKLRRLLGGK